MLGCLPQNADLPVTGGSTTIAVVAGALTLAGVIAVACSRRHRPVVATVAVLALTAFLLALPTRSASACEATPTPPSTTVPDPATTTTTALVDPATTTTTLVATTTSTTTSTTTTSSTTTTTLAPAPVDALDDNGRLDTDGVNPRTLSYVLVGNDTLGVPAAQAVSFGGGSLGGTVDSYVVGSTVEISGGLISVRLDPNGHLTVTAQPVDTTIELLYRIRNAAGETDTATVQIVITRPTPPPV